MGVLKTVAGVTLASLLSLGVVQAQVQQVVRPLIKVAAPRAATKADFNGSHEESGVIEIKQGGGSTILNTFCVDASGNVLAACGGDHLKTWKMDITPQAICVADDGTVYVAGDGRIVHLDSKGKVLTTVDSPHVGDMEKFAENVKKEAIEQQARKNVRRSNRSDRSQS